ncbi:MAG: hypothetical protein JW801_14865 [Bacteroidales bacterium]|nr:hypothetical protein [Bacteroidales bacterium]
MKNVMNFRTVFATAALFVSMGLFAQTHPGTTLPGASTDYASGVAEGTTYVVSGMTIPVWASPDAYYHPLYNAATSTWTLTDDFTWTWGDVSTTLTFGTNNAEDNYNTITAGAAGTYPITVTENAPAAYGGCSGAATTIDVIVVDQPAVTLGGTASYSLCEGNAGLPANITATISDGWQNYRLVWTLQIKTLNADLTDKDLYDTDKATTIAGLAEEYTPAVPEAVAAAGGHDITSVAGGFTVIDNSSTVYTYTLTSINDQASRFGNFIALDGDLTDPSAFTYFANAETVTITVHPTPTTGPIYHIQSGWAN